TGGTADRNRSHWSTSKTPSYTKSVSWQHHRQPQDIANAALFLCSPAASWVSGQILTVSGGGVQELN
ncbi:SDR family oxidoreductase, partial [Escherichia coli]|uniref:SDR family oxidoreductase n=7 Tax=Escherichia coli TaxID=562 RepID=UPI0021F61AE1